MDTEKEIHVVKRNGEKERLDLEKFHKVVAFACEGITGVSESEIELKSHINFFDGIKTSEIQETLIKAAADLITEDTPNYQWVASRLINYHLRRMVYGDIEPWPILKLVEKNVGEGFYDPELLDMYDADEWEQMDGFIRHNRDYDISYCGMEQMRGKYLVQNRVLKQIKETPQMAYMLIGASLFSRYPKETRLKWVRDFYQCVSTFQVSLPTPICAGVRTSQRQFSSCVLIECGDSLDSINATSSAIVKYVSQRAGIGIGVGAIRGIGSAVRNGDTYHTGMIPFLKLFQAAVNSCSQGSVRKGSATCFRPLWSYENDELIVLKNNKGIEANRVRQIDYGIQISNYFYQRLIEGKDISFFSTSEVPGLYEAYFEDSDKFQELYEAAEADTSIRRRTKPALEVFTELMNERKNTGRIYIYNVDNVKDQGMFKPSKAPVRQSNLCLEVVLPCKPLDNINDDKGEISTCTLAALNFGKFGVKEEMRKPCEIIVRALNELLDFQRYPVLAAELSTKDRRPLGVGIINLAYWMAKNDMTYTRPKLRLIDEWAEAWSYYLIDASCRLAEEQGPCPKNEDTRYSDGLVPCDLRKKDVDDLISHQENLPWDDLRQRLKKYGIRNSVLMALMPSETSSQVSNSTNGVEPPRAAVSVKQSKDGVLKQVVPGIHKLKDKYEYLWDQKSPVGYLKVMAVLQKWTDQAISVNTSYCPSYYPNRKIPMSDLIKHMLLHCKYGGKTLYYCNTNDGAGELDVEKLGEKKDLQLMEETVEQEEETCESCTI